MVSTFSHVVKGDLEYLVVPAFERAGGIRHCFTTRRGGVSAGSFAGLNLRSGRGDPDANVAANFLAICAAVGFSAGNAVFAGQIHGDSVLRVDRGTPGGSILGGAACHSDALITNVPGIPLVGFFADCMPVFLYDPVKRAAGIVHSGWRGTALRIAAKAVSLLEREYGCRPQDVLAAIGPSVGPCHYQVGSDVAVAFEEAFGADAGMILRPMGGGKYIADLWAAGKITLTQAGVLPENITVAGECTCCRGELYYSHRVQGAARGAMAGIVELLEVESR